MDQQVELDGAVADLNQITTPITTPPDVEVSPDLLLDPTDYPLDNQAELVAMQSEPVGQPQTVDVVNEASMPQLGVAADSISELLDLQHTIKTEGVSSHDMAGMQAIQQRMIDNGVALPNVGLEEHIGYFTPERSLLNQSLGMESIGKVILDTIKAWLRKLIDIVMQGYRWVKAQSTKHAKLDTQLDHARDVMLKVREIYKKIQTMTTPLPDDAVNSIKELTETALVVSNLERNKLTLYGYSDESAVRDVKALYTSALESAEAVASRVTVLAQLLDNKEIPSDDSMCALSDLAAVSVSVDEMLQVSDDPEYLVEKLGGDFWDRIVLFRKVKIIDFDKLTKCYGSTADALGRVRSIKIEDQAQAERAQVIIDSITKAVNELNKIVNFFNRCAQSQVQAIRSYQEYYTKALEIHALVFKAGSPNPASVKAFEALIAEMAKLK